MRKSLICITAGCMVSLAVSLGGIYTLLRFDCFERIDWALPSTTAYEDFGVCVSASHSVFPIGITQIGSLECGRDWYYECATSSRIQLWPLQCETRKFYNLKDCAEVTTRSHQLEVSEPFSS